MIGRIGGHTDEVMYRWGDGVTRRTREREKIVATDPLSIIHSLLPEVSTAPSAQFQPTSETDRTECWGRKTLTKMGYAAAGTTKFSIPSITFIASMCVPLVISLSTSLPSVT